MAPNLSVFSHSWQLMDIQIGNKEVSATSLLTSTLFGYPLAVKSTSLWRWLVWKYRDPSNSSYHFVVAYVYELQSSGDILSGFHPYSALSIYIPTWLQLIIIPGIWRVLVCLVIQEHWKITNKKSPRELKEFLLGVYCIFQCSWMTKQTSQR